MPDEGPGDTDGPGTPPTTRSGGRSRPRSPIASTCRRTSGSSVTPCGSTPARSRAIRGGCPWPTRSSRPGSVTSGSSRSAGPGRRARSCAPRSGDVVRRQMGNRDSSKPSSGPSPRNTTDESTKRTTVAGPDIDAVANRPFSSHAGVDARDRGHGERRRGGGRA